MTALSGCTAMNETDKADLKATPTTPAPSTDMAAVVTAPAMYDLEDGTQVAVLLPTPKPGSEISLALAPAIATPVDTANAAVLAETPTAAVAVASAQNGLVTAMVAPTDTTLTAEISAVQSIVPTPKPATATMLAYAAPSKGGSLAAIDNQYDLSGPAAPQIIAPAPGAAALSGPTALNGLISKYAKIYDMPEALIHRVVHRESRYNPAAFNGGHYGLMQIKYATAKSMGYDGPAAGLFDAETNIKYAAKYLRGAWLVADNSNDNAVRLYARGYYYDAKSKGMLHVLQP
ncbi:lytic transglycosylase domain-containing protein [Rhizobium sp. CG5]|uniref:lytic transglycosylase domain-containing protein n=1 Tax=Rhizobium sp. CG5 TaxID=2726076 RepID=UPI0020347F20|nr:lytic transglycosylase domain-containing protein [Rhizobium sp. CG5]